MRGWGVIAVLTALAGSASPALVAAPGFAADVQVGDVVLRAGQGREALAVSLASGAELTHIGLVTGFDRGGQAVVTHADPQGGAAAVVRTEPLSEFAAPAVASAVQVWRPRYASAASRARTIGFAQAAARRRAGFDSQLQMATPGRLYCSELVVRALDAGAYRWRQRPAVVAVPLMPEPIVMPAALAPAGGFVRVAGWAVSPAG
jgi:hypothetical protein